MVPGAHEHCLVAQEHALLPTPENTLADLFRLPLLVEAEHEHRLLRPVPLGDEATVE